MDRSEYMRLKGELVTATETLATLRGDKSRALQELQGMAAAFASKKIDHDGAAKAHDLIDRLLLLQQQESTLTADESRFKQALAGVSVPAA